MNLVNSYIYMRFEQNEVKLHFYPKKNFEKKSK